MRNYESKSFEKFFFGSSRGVRRRGDLVKHQWVMRLLHYVRNDRGSIFQSSSQELLRSTRNDPLKKYAAVFLDRDGTINEEVGYLDSLDKLRLFENTAEAIRLINESGMKAVVITNQSGVARGYFTEEFVEIVHGQIQNLLNKRGAFIDAFYYCPHHPTEGIGYYLKICPCRKPEPGMLIAAAEELNIDLNRSYAIGDMLKDIEAARRVGAKSILVKTGYGLKMMENDLWRTPTEYSPEEKGNPDAFETLQPDYIAEDILDAVTWIMRDRNLTKPRAKRGGE